MKNILLYLFAVMIATLSSVFAGDGNGSAFNLKTNDSDNHSKVNLSANADGKDVNQTYSYMFHKKMNNLVNTFTNVAPTMQNAVFLSAFKDSNMLNSAKTTHNINLQVVDAKAIKLKNNLTGSAVFVYMNTTIKKDAKNINFTGLNVNTGSNISFAKSFEKTFINKNNIENGKIDKYAGATNIFDLRDNTIMTANTATNMNNNTENVIINATTNAYFTNNSDTIGAATIAFQDGDKKSIGMPFSA